MPLTDAELTSVSKGVKRAFITTLRSTLSFVRRSGDAISKLDWAGDGAERLEAFAGAEDRHIAIVEHASED
jgi:hypothetical protein